MVDTTQSSSWDDWAQGFYPSSTAGSGSGAGLKPYMSCPGQGTDAAGTPNQDLFFFTLFDQPNYLDWYNYTHNGGTLHTLPYNSQFKCYDSMKIWNQVQPAPYDGRYSFPSSLGINPTNGKLLAANGSTNGVASLDDRDELHDLHRESGFDGQISCRYPDAAARQVRGGSDHAAGL